MRTLWAADPVKYWRAAPQTSGWTVRRSTWRPSRVRTDALVSPRAATSATWGSSVKARLTAAGSVEAASRSRSWTVAFMRRSDPATSTRSTSGTPASRSRRVSARGRARARGMPSPRWAIRSRARRRLASVRAPMPGRPATRPAARASASSSGEDTPSRSWTSRAQAGHPDQGPQTGRDLGPELLQLGHPAGVQVLADLGGDRLADPGDGRQVALGQLGQVGAVARQGAGAAVVGPDPEAGLARELQQLGHLREQPRQLLVVPD